MTSVPSGQQIQSPNPYVWMLSFPGLILTYNQIHIHINKQSNFRSMFSETVIVVGNGIDDPSSNREQSCLCFIYWLNSTHDIIGYVNISKSAFL